MAEGAVSITALASGSLHHIFSYLSPADLCCVSATCKHWRDLSHDQAANQVWRHFYEQRWRPTIAETRKDICWQTAYGSKMKRVGCWHHKHFEQDSLYGHHGGIHCLGIVSGHSLVATGSFDRTVKIWDMKAGMPLASSRLHGGTVRCLAVDENALVSGSSDHKVRVWLAEHSNKAGFDLSDPIRLGKNGHTGPIAALALDKECIYSGSWDYSVRLWHRSSLQLAGIVPFDDWVFGLASRADHLLAGVSSRLHVLDLATLKPLKRIWHQPGAVIKVEGTRDGRLAFSGGQDGCILAHDLRLPDASATVAVLWETSAGVGSLTLEDPWLAAALSDGTVALLNTEVAMRQRHHRGSSSNSAPPKRLFQLPAGAAHCADLADQWLVAGSETGVTCSWDFSKAEEKEQQVLAAKAARGKARQLKAEKHSQRLSQQREKAAANLARLTQISSDAAAAERDATNDGAASVESITAQASEHAADAFQPGKGDCLSPEKSNHRREWQNTSMPHASIPSQSITGTLGLARSLPVDIANHTKSGPRSLIDAADKETPPSSPVQSQSLRRFASAAASSPRLTRVPGPVLHTCAAESRDSPSSMQCWQIVRPRPVKNDRGIVRGLSHVNVKA